MESYRTIAEGVCKVFKEAVKKNLNVEYDEDAWDPMNIGEIQSRIYRIRGDVGKYLNVVVMRVSSGMYEVKDYIV